MNCLAREEENGKIKIKDRDRNTIELIGVDGKFLLFIVHI